MVAKLRILLLAVAVAVSALAGAASASEAGVFAVVAPPQKSKAKSTNTKNNTKTKAKPKSAGSTKSKGPTQQKAAKQSAPKTSADAKKQRRQTEQQIARTAKEIKAAEAEITRNLRKVSRLEGDIERTEATEHRLQERIDSLNLRSRLVKDSITAGENELQRLRELYIRAVRSSRKNRREMTPVTFIFSASTVRQAWRRMGYLEEFSKWRGRKSDEITALIADLEAKRADLEDMKNKVLNLRREAQAQGRKLRNDRASLQTAVGNLQGKQKELNSMLEKQKATLAKLDREIERLIQKEMEEERKRREAEERRKAAEAKNGGSKESAKTPSDKKPKSDFVPGATAANSPGNFAAQKGKLPSPLSHTYAVVQGFGVQKHHSIKTLEVNNPGVDLETAANATARAVYPGVVSAVFVQEGLGHVVLVRHGEYLTVYANIKNLRVGKGSKLKTGDAIGSVGPSDVDPARGQLHFEIRREREKFNPMQWLKR